MTSNLENLQSNNPNDKEMSLLEHFKELRGRITWMAGAIVIGMGICFTAFGFTLMEFLEEPARKYFYSISIRLLTCSMLIYISNF